MYTEFNGERHILRPTPLERYLKDRFKDDRFFTVWNKNAETWIVAYWLDHCHTKYVELLLLKNLGDADRKSLESIESWFRRKDKSLKDMRYELYLHARAVDREDDDFRGEQQEFWRSVRRRASTQYSDDPWLKAQAGEMN